MHVRTLFLPILSFLVIGASIPLSAEESTTVASDPLRREQMELIDSPIVEDSSRIDGSNVEDDEYEPDDYLHYPAGIPTGEFRGLIGINMTILPQILVEDQIRQSPMLTGQVRYGLPGNFSVDASVTSNIIANFIAIGPRWGLDFERFSLGVSARLGYWYGFAPIEGFDIVATSWLNYPGLEIGLRLDDVRATLRAEAQIVTALRITSDAIETSSSKNTIGGYALDIHIEQPFWGDSSTSLGLRLNYSKSMYQAWLAFSTLDVYQVYPEFTIALLF